MKILNVESLCEKFMHKGDDGLTTKSLGSAAGSQRIYVNIDSVPPNSFSTKYHSHSQQEEFFLILEGYGILRLDNNEYPVKKGDFIAKPSAHNNAHTFYNSSDEILMILDVGTNEKEDTCYYPDEEVYLHKSNGISKAFRKHSVISEWTSDPNKN